MTPRRELVEPNAPLSMRWQCELLGVNRSSLYYEPVEPDGEQLALMRRMDELHLKHPFFGSRMMTQILKAEGSGQPQACAASHAVTRALEAVRKRTHGILFRFSL